MLVEEFMIKSKYEINIKILESNKKYLDEALLKKEEIEDEIEQAEKDSVAEDIIDAAEAIQLIR